MNLLCNVDFDLNLVGSFFNCTAMCHDGIVAVISGVFSYLADLLDEFFHSLGVFLFVLAQASVAASFDITGLAISDGFGSIAAGGAVMTCFDLACARFQSLFAVFLDLLVEFVDRFSHFLMTFCIVFFLSSTNDFCDLRNQLLYSCTTMLLF